MSTLLQVRGLRAGYGAIRVLHGVDFEVDEAEIVALPGPIGACKTATPREIGANPGLVSPFVREAA